MPKTIRLLRRHRMRNVDRKAPLLRRHRMRNVDRKAPLLRRHRMRNAARMARLLRPRLTRNVVQMVRPRPMQNAGRTAHRLGMDTVGRTVLLLSQMALGDLVKAGEMAPADLVAAVVAKALVVPAVVVDAVVVAAKGLAAPVVVVARLTTGPRWIRNNCSRILTQTAMAR